jgi:Fe-S-cluster containining protein
MMDLHNWEQKSAARQGIYKKWLATANLKQFVHRLPDLHQQAFDRISCLDCAKCCKNYSPRFKAPDIRRASKYLKMSEKAFMDAYLIMDEDSDYVVKSKPCPFLAGDNTCAIYDKRPQDCARFPYTDEDVFIKKKAITLKNSTFCPAVYFVLEKLTAE